jgi:hypothetical protein
MHVNFATRQTRISIATNQNIFDLMDIFPNACNCMQWIINSSFTHMKIALNLASHTPSLYELAVTIAIQSAIVVRNASEAIRARLTGHSCHEKHG